MSDRIKCTNCGAESMASGATLVCGACWNGLQADNRKLRGIVNLMADQLAHYNGETVPTVIQSVVLAVEAGAEIWDPLRRKYVGGDF